MTSKEALEKLYDGFQDGMAGRSFYDIIKEDLDRLEKLEKENQELKQTIEELTDIDYEKYDDQFIE